MRNTLAFDVYGTLIDTQGITDELKTLVGARAAEVATLWRSKQLEYSFRRGLMHRYRDFSVCTANALEYCNQVFNLGLTGQHTDQLMQAYRRLPAFDDVVPALTELSDQGQRVFAFSNGSADAVQALLEHAGIAELFEGIVSVEEIKTFKPDPAVYQHFLRQTASDPERSWLVSGNCFDIIGADAVGMRTAWVQRQPDAVFDPWDSQPEFTIRSLKELAAKLTS
ncbi:haloacid dehalogenase type II [Aliidiomarina sp. Khilg15.8]